MTADDFRALALDLPGAVEREHMGHPDFRANGRIFATLHADDEWGMVKVQPAEQEALMADHPGVFVPAAGAWGRQGCTNVRLKEARSAAGTGRLDAGLGTGQPSAAAARQGRRTRGYRRDSAVSRTTSSRPLTRTWAPAPTPKVQ